MLIPPRNGYATARKVPQNRVLHVAWHVRRDHGPRNRATLKRVALNAVRIVTGKNSIRHTMRDAVLDVRVLADILNHMPVA